MESTTKMNALGATGSKILYIIALTAAACIVSRCTVMGDSFICGISFIAYMMSKSTLNIYLILPAAAGLLPYISQGYDPWGYIIAMVICGFVFTGIRKIPLMLWQRGLIAASISIIAVSIYSLATGSVYKTSPEELAAEGAIIVLLIYIFDAMYQSSIKANSLADQKTHSSRFPLTAFVTVSLMVVSGLGLSFIIWSVLIFIALWVLSCAGAGDAMIAASSGGIAAYLLGQGQWGLMATIMLGLLAASYVKAHGFVLMTLIFSGACLITGISESGVVLGIDKYILFIPAMMFIALYWKFGDNMRKVMNCFMRENVDAEANDAFLRDILKDKSSQMSDLTELYSTYLDSRAVMANQFDLTRQIIDDIRWQISKQGRRAASGEHDRFGVDIAISQCAASGVINGDCCGWQDLGDGRVVMVVSDGMGKGKKAAAESLMVTRTMISLLKSGVTVDLALKMINTIMLMKADEDSYATLDMVTVDKHSGKAKFYKIGAAPTLIRRKSNVEEVKLSAVPLGIVNGLKVRYVETVLKKDDWIIMMSDGVSDGGLHKIKETTANVRSADPRTMSDLIMNRAADSYIGRERDDLTVMVARIL